MAPSILSHPAGGAWIEIFNPIIHCFQLFGRTPQGVRGLKWQDVSGTPPHSRRTPQGVRGLK